MLAAAPCDPPLVPQQKGFFVTDAEIKRLIKDCAPNVGRCPKNVERSALLDVAKRFGVIHPEDAELKATSSQSRKRKRTWVDLVREAPSLQECPFGQSLEYRRDEALRLQLQSLVGGGVVVPPRAPRELLVELAIQKNVLTRAQADVPAPPYIDKERLGELCREVKRRCPEMKLPSTRDAKLAILVEQGLVTECEASAKRKREDLSKKKKASSGRDENADPTLRRTRTVPLGALLYGKDGAFKAAAMERVREEVEALSKLLYERGFLLWLHLHRLVEAGEASSLPHETNDLVTFVRQIITIRTRSKEGKESTVKELGAVATFEKYNAYLRNDAPRTTIENSLTHAAKLYATALKRHLTDPSVLENRIKKYCRARLLGVVVRPKEGQEDAAPTADDETLAVRMRGGRPDDVGENPLYNVIAALTDEQYDTTAMHPAQTGVVEEVRRSLGLAAGVRLNRAWLESNLFGSLRFAHLVATTCDALREEAVALYKELERAVPDKASRPPVHRGCTRGCKFVPLMKRTRRFMALDATSLVKLLNLRSVPGIEGVSESVVREFLMPGIRKAFGKTYTCTSDADRRSRTTKTAWTFTGTIYTDGLFARVHFERSRRPGESGDRKKATSKRQRSDSATEPSRLVAPPRILLSVDTGRINVATIAVFLNGVPVLDKRKRPLSFILTARAYHTMIGNRLQSAVTKRAVARSNDALKKLRSELSATCLHTGDAFNVLRYLRALSRYRSADDEEWSRTLGNAACRRRNMRTVSKERILTKWFLGVKRSVKRATGCADDEALVVWGCQVAATGLGNLSAPTGRVHEAAKHVPGWNVVRGDEYNTSQKASDSGHKQLCSVRVAGSPAPARKEISRSAAQRCVKTAVRSGWAIGLNARRLIRRQSRPRLWRSSTPDRRITKMARTAWRYDGHDGESKAAKAVKAEARKAAGKTVRYVRGLRVLEDDNNTKFYDRDVNAAVNIGIIWLGDNVEGWRRPVAFERPKKKKP